MQPDVSFVIAAFNAEGSIARVVESALAQRGVTVEVIVVDDRSSDRTAEVARGFPSERVRVVELDENRGPGGARNAGLEVARGRWIAVLDADDTVYPDRLARMIHRAESRGARIAVDNLDVVEEAKGETRTMFAQSHLEKLPELTLVDFIASGIMFKRTFSFGYMKPIFERRFIEQHALRYDETLRIGEDYIFMASALAKGGSCAVEPSAGYAYRIRAGSISRVLQLHHVEAMLLADAAFVCSHALDPHALKAQARRTRSLKEAASFLSLVRHLKDRAPLKATIAALRHPRALHLLKMPVIARLRRFATLFQSRDEVGAAS